VTAPLPPPGWYPDPSGVAAQRYWDGREWTAVNVPSMSPFAPPRARSSASQSGQGSTSRRPGFRDAWAHKEVISIGIAVCGVIAGLVRWNGRLVNFMAEIGRSGGVRSSL
jgi:hypothetical protein